MKSRIIILIYVVTRVLSVDKIEVFSGLNIQTSSLENYKTLKWEMTKGDLQNFNNLITLNSKSNISKMSSILEINGNDYKFSSTFNLNNLVSQKLNTDSYDCLLEESDLLYYPNEVSNFNLKNLISTHKITIGNTIPDQGIKSISIVENQLKIQNLVTSQSNISRIYGYIGSQEDYIFAQTYDNSHIDIYRVNDTNFELDSCLNYTINSILRMFYFKGFYIIFPQNGGINIFDVNQTIKFQQNLTTYFNDALIMDDFLICVIKGFGIKVLNLENLSQRKEPVWSTTEFPNNYIRSISLYKNDNNDNYLGASLKKNNEQIFYIELKIKDNILRPFKIYKSDNLEYDEPLLIDRFSFFYDKNNKKLIMIEMGRDLSSDNLIIQSDLTNFTNSLSSSLTFLKRIKNNSSQNNQNIIKDSLALISANGNMVILNEIKFIDPLMTCDLKRFGKYNFNLISYSETCFKNNKNYSNCEINTNLIFDFNSDDLNTVNSSEEELLEYITILKYFVLTLLVIVFTYSFVNLCIVIYKDYKANKGKKNYNVAVELADENVETTKKI